MLPKNTAVFYHVQFFINFFFVSIIMHLWLLLCLNLCAFKRNGNKNGFPNRTPKCHFIRWLFEYPIIRETLVFYAMFSPTLRLQNIALYWIRSGWIFLLRVTISTIRPKWIGKVRNTCASVHKINRVYKAILLPITGLYLYEDFGYKLYFGFKERQWRAQEGMFGIFSPSYCGLIFLKLHLGIYLVIQSGKYWFIEEIYIFGFGCWISFGMHYVIFRIPLCKFLGKPPRKSYSRLDNPYSLHVHIPL